MKVFSCVYDYSVNVATVNVNFQQYKGTFACLELSPVNHFGYTHTHNYEFWCKVSFCTYFALFQHHGRPLPPALYQPDTAPPSAYTTSYTGSL